MSRAFGSFDLAGPSGVFVVVVAALVATSGCSRPPALSVGAPSRITRALGVVDDLGCDAVLVDKEGQPGEAQALERGADGVSFSGFLAADPGNYTLELTFTGLRADPDAGGEQDRHFLGRLTSDSFTVVAGNSSEPTFSTGLDTLGRDDEGDEDGDGLGFLDELIVGGDPGDSDSDDDGVDDGDDCDPASGGNAYAIVAGGSLDDCDGDGFVRVDPFFDDGGDGGDCADIDAAVHPGVDDDCGTLLDQDCDPSSCPVNDAEGPTVVIERPRAGETWGCGLRVSATISDPSGVTSAVARFPDDPLGGQARAMQMAPAGDGGDGDDGFLSQPILQLASTGYRPGAHLLEVQAFDGTGNARTVSTTFELDIRQPTITLDVSGAGASADGDVVSGGTATLRFAASGPGPITSFKVFQAPASTTSPTLFDLEAATELAVLASGSGSVVVDPADFAVRSVVYAVAGDDALRELGPFITASASVSTTGPGGSLFASACDGDFNRVVPAVVVEPPPGAGDLVTMTGKLQDAVDRARAIDPAARLAAVFSLGADASGRVDLEDVGNFSFRWEYRFLKANGDGITVRWLTPAFGNDRPNIEAAVQDPLDSAAIVADPFDLADSDDAVAAYNASGCGTFSGDDSDQIIVQRSDPDDRYLLIANGGGTLALDAVTLVELFRSCP